MYITWGDLNLKRAGHKSWSNTRCRSWLLQVTLLRRFQGELRHERPGYSQSCL